MCLHDMIAHIKGEEVHVHYKWELRAFDVLYEGLAALWSDDQPHMRGTTTAPPSCVLLWPFGSSSSPSVLPIAA